MNLNDYQNAALRTAVYPGQGSALGLAYVALKLNGEAGEFAEHFGKSLRDDDLVRVTTSYGMGVGTVLVQVNELTPERMLKLKKELGDVLWYLAAGARELGVSLADIAAINLEKLSGRATAGTLQGSGDDR